MIGCEVYFFYKLKKRKFMFLFSQVSSNQVKDETNRKKK